MKLTVDPASHEPIYQQLYDQLSSQIMRGELSGGYCLPPIRTLAKELKISVITVKRAWEELERGGYIVTMVGKGCFVSEHADNVLEKKRTDAALDKLGKDMEYYGSLGFSPRDIARMIEENF